MKTMKITTESSSISDPCYFDVEVLYITDCKVGSELLLGRCKDLGEYYIGIKVDSYSCATGFAIGDTLLALNRFIDFITSGYSLLTKGVSGRDKYESSYGGINFRMSRTGSKLQIASWPFGREFDSKIDVNIFPDSFDSVNKFIAGITAYYGSVISSDSVGDYDYAMGMI